ncbi:hypothetical protein M0R45_005922 [Rubus argutus]|uniref:Secreted protein n=1 Tax=Rubus argutus TaxID=59490 RepID=A0AAW1YP93_RUBAR
MGAVARFCLVVCLLLCKDPHPSLLQCRLRSFGVAAVSLCFLSLPSSGYGGHGGLVLPAFQGFPLEQRSIFFEPGFQFFPNAVMGFSLGVAGV